MPFKDKVARASARALWEEKNRAKIREQTKVRQTKFWTVHERPKQLSTFDRFENRRRIRELKVLGIHMLIVGEVKRGFQVIPKLARSITGCIDCGNPKRLMIL